MEREPNAETAALAEVMVDPLNRFYRYRVCYWILPLVQNTRITPNQVTYFHTLVGFVAAWFVARGTDRGLLVGFVLSEIRMILDCFDGVLARAKKISSPYGRTIDELGDASAYLAMCAAIYIHVHAREPELPAGLMLFGMMATGGVMAWVHDFYKRKFSSALKSGSDGIFDELLAKYVKIREGGAGFVTRFGFAFDWAQVVILASGTRREVEARLEQAVAGGDPNALPLAASGVEVPYILKNAHSKGLRVVLRAISLMCGDNAIAILNIGMLLGAVAKAQTLVIVYGCFTMGMGILLCNVFLHGSRRALEGSTSIHR
jgi:hypothetical protein